MFVYKFALNTCTMESRKKKRKRKVENTPKKYDFGGQKNRLLRALAVLVGLLHTEYLWNHLHKCITWCNVAIAFNTSMHSDPHSNTHTHTHTHTQSGGYYDSPGK